MILIVRVRLNSNITVTGETKTWPTRIVHTDLRILKCTKNVGSGELRTISVGCSNLNIRSELQKVVI